MFVGDGSRQRRLICVFLSPRSKDIDRATYHFTRTIALDPNYADAHFNLGIVYQEMGELAKALQCYETASGLDPQLENNSATGE